MKYQFQSNVLKIEPVYKHLYTIFLLVQLYSSFKLKRGGSIGHFESSSLSLLWGTAVAHGGVLANCGVVGAGPRLLVAHDGQVT